MDRVESATAVTTAIRIGSFMGKCSYTSRSRSYDSGIEVFLHSSEHYTVLFKDGGNLSHSKTPTELLLPSTFKSCSTHGIVPHRHSPFKTEPVDGMENYMFSLIARSMNAEQGATLRRRAWSLKHLDLWEQDGLCNSAV